MCMTSPNNNLMFISLFEDQSLFLVFGFEVLDLAMC